MRVEPEPFNCPDLVLIRLFEIDFSGGRLFQFALHKIKKKSSTMILTMILDHYQTSRRILKKTHDVSDDINITRYDIESLLNFCR